MTEPVRTTVATIERQGELLVYRYDDQAVVDEAEAREALAAGATLAPDGPLSTLVVMSGVRRVTASARAIFASEENYRITNRVALVVGSPLSRVIGNFFLGLNKPAWPTRLFNAEQAAVEWLRAE